jgi:hypothetical protein
MHALLIHNATNTLHAPIATAARSRRPKASCGFAVMQRSGLLALPSCGPGRCSKVHPCTGGLHLGEYMAAVRCRVQARSILYCGADPRAAQVRGHRISLGVAIAAGVHPSVTLAVLGVLAAPRVVVARRELVMVRVGR